MSMAKRKISQWWLAGLAAMFPAGVLMVLRYIVWVTKGDGVGSLPAMR